MSHQRRIAGDRLLHPRPGKLSLMLLCLVAVLAMTGMALALAAPTLSGHVVAGGGGRSESVGYILEGTIGQPSTGVVDSENFTLSGGFRAGGGDVDYRIYLPLVMR